MVQVTMHDGSMIEAEVNGSGPTLLLPVDPQPVEGEQADEMRKWGTDPALGRSLIDGLSDVFQVVAFDYTGHVLSAPKPDTLTPGNVVADLLAVADAVQAERFAYYGYSWLALSGLQLAIRTDRLSALAMGGYPPYAGPYAEMLKVTMAAYEQAVSPTPAPACRRRAPTTPSTGRRSRSARPWSRAGSSSRCTRRCAASTTRRSGSPAPGCASAGSDDAITYEERWGGVVVDLAGPLKRHRAELEALGWEVVVLDGLDHMSAMQAANVLPVLRPWLTAALLT